MNQRLDAIQMKLPSVEDKFVDTKVLNYNRSSKNLKVIKNANFGKNTLQSNREEKKEEKEILMKSN